MSLTDSIKAAARELGFSRAAVLPPGPALSHPFYRAWLEAGFGGEMDYLSRHAPRKSSPAALAPWARSLIVLSINYHRPWPAAPPEGLHGRVSRYAWARDYHAVIGEKLEALAAFIRGRAGGETRTQACVDSAPLMEREFAARAGLGWVGRHGNLIHWRDGSWLFLAELLVETELEYDTPPPVRRRAASPPPLWGGAYPPGLALRESCGSCRACIEACPTAAIVADKTVDARRCISYLTIELKKPIPADLRPLMGDWVFGCDICQDVCPWNRKAPLGEEKPFGPAGPGSARPSLPALLALGETEFRDRFRETPLARPKRRGLLRNAAVALGNALASGGVPAPERRKGLAALEGALTDQETLVRGAAAWALGRAGAAQGSPALRRTLERETDPAVAGEIKAALALPLKDPTGQKKAVLP